MNHSAPRRQVCYVAIVITWLLGALQGVAAHDAKKDNLHAGEEIGYPRANWRVDPSSLNGVAFDLERIVIAHREAEVMPRELSVIARSSRSPAQALSLVRDLAGQIRDHPNAFASLATRYSDDLSSRRWGGALGLVSAGMISPEIVDALDVVPEGAVTKPIPTANGYELVRRRKPRQQQELIGEVVFVRHAQSRGPLGTVERTRAEAEKLAEVVAGTATLGASFSSLVARYSEYPRDQVVVKTTDADNRALLVHVLSLTPVGGTAGPIETVEGFYVVKRLADMCRMALSTREIIVGHLASVPKRLSSSLSRPEAARLADELARDLAMHESPQESVVLGRCIRTACHPRDWRWYAGERTQELESRVLRLEPGSGATEVVETRAGFHVLSRELNPTIPAATRALSYEVPRPRALTFDELLRTASGPYVAAVTARESAAFSARLNRESAERFRTVVESLAGELATAELEVRPELMRQMKQRLGDILGDELLEAYQHFMDGQLEKIQKSLRFDRSSQPG